MNSIIIILFGDALLSVITAGNCCFCWLLMNSCGGGNGLCVNGGCGNCDCCRICCCCNFCSSSCNVSQIPDQIRFAGPSCSSWNHAMAGSIHPSSSFLFTHNQMFFFILKIVFFCLLFVANNDDWWLFVFIFLIQFLYCLLIVLWLFFI